MRYLIFIMLYLLFAVKSSSQSITSLATFDTIIMIEHTESIVSYPNRNLIIKEFENSYFVMDQVQLRKDTIVVNELDSNRHLLINKFFLTDSVRAILGGYSYRLLDFSINEDFFFLLTESRYIVVINRNNMLKQSILKLSDGYHKVSCLDDDRVLLCSFGNPIVKFAILDITNQKVIKEGKIEFVLPAINHLKGAYYVVYRDGFIIVDPISSKFYKYNHSGELIGTYLVNLRDWTKVSRKLISKASSLPPSGSLASYMLDESYKFSRIVTIDLYNDTLLILYYQNSRVKNDFQDELRRNYAILNLQDSLRIENDSLEYNYTSINLDEIYDTDKKYFEFGSMHVSDPIIKDGELFFIKVGINKPPFGFVYKDYLNERGNYFKNYFPLVNAYFYYFSL